MLKRKFLLLAALLAGLLLAGHFVLSYSAGSPATFDLNWNTVAGSSLTGNTAGSAGGNLSLDGTAGQPAVGMQLNLPGRSLDGGFWAGGTPMFQLSLPLVRK